MSILLAIPIPGSHRNSFQGRKITVESLHNHEKLEAVNQGDDTGYNHTMGIWIVIAMWRQVDLLLSVMSKKWQTSIEKTVWVSMPHVRDGSSVLWPFWRILEVGMDVLRSNGEWVQIKMNQLISVYSLYCLYCYTICQPMLCRSWMTCVYTSVFSSSMCQQNSLLQSCPEKHLQLSNLKCLLLGGTVMTAFTDTICNAVLCHQHPTYLVYTTYKTSDTWTNR